MMTSSNDFGTNMRELRNNDDTSNVGTKWTIEEDNKLAQEFLENKTYDEIALEHKRTVYGIVLRVISRIIYPKIKDVDTDIDIVKHLSLEYRVDSSQLTRYINKIKIKETENKDKSIKKPKQKDVEPTNKQILEYLQKIDSKLNEINSKLDNLELI